jgi:hypothetical protein
MAPVQTGQARRRRAAAAAAPAAGEPVASEDELSARARTAFPTASGPAPSGGELIDLPSTESLQTSPVVRPSLPQGERGWRAVPRGSFRSRAWSTTQRCWSWWRGMGEDGERVEEGGREGESSELGERRTWRS